MQRGQSCLQAIGRKPGNDEALVALVVVAAAGSIEQEARESLSVIRFRHQAVADKHCEKPQAVVG